MPTISPQPAIAHWMKFSGTSMNPVAFGRVEPFDGALLHRLCPKSVLMPEKARAATPHGATAQISEESARSLARVAGKTAPAKMPKSDCHVRKADEYAASMASISRQAASALAVECKSFALLVRFAEREFKRGIDKTIIRWNRRAARRNL
jgi:hypothetical protein